MASLDQDILDQLAATSPAARQLIDQYRARRRGRPRTAEFQYRRLQSWWKCFRRSHSDLTDEQAARKFLRLRGSAIAKDLGLKRTNFNSLRNAVSRGEKESERIKSQRAARWQIVPTSLVDAVHGRHYRIETDPNMAIIIRGAIRRALSGE
jgi:hypothetical protein